jgi:alkylation response protein AidB-like acyl-CoA dehydrogenase
VGANLAPNGSELKAKSLGAQDSGWQGEGFDDNDLETSKNWLRLSAVTIYGGTTEVQMNIVSKRVLHVLGMPD